jgi:hypothetical protein
VKLRAKGSFDIFYLVILDNNVPTMPASTTYKSTGTGNWIGAAALKLENLHGILDLLRNEKPIYMCLSDTLPMSNYVSTSEEPIGEGIDMSP